MKRQDFIKIIKIRSFWETGKGGYKLPSGESISTYIETLVNGQINLDSLVINKEGDLVTGTIGKWDPEQKRFTDYIASVPFGEDEVCSFDEQMKRLEALVREIVWN